MGLFKQAVHTQNTFVNVDIRGLGGSAKDARKVQSWGGPAAFASEKQENIMELDVWDSILEVDEFEQDGVSCSTFADADDYLDLSLDSVQSSQGEMSSGMEMQSHGASSQAMSSGMQVQQPANTEHLRTRSGDAQIFPQEVPAGQFVTMPFPVGMPGVVHASPFVMMWSPQVPYQATVPVQAPPHVPLRARPHLVANAFQSSAKKHQRVQAEEQRVQAESGLACEDQRVEGDSGMAWTSRMLRNVPNDYEREELLELLDAHGLQYNFFYLPMDWNKKANLGYAFVNLVSHHEAVRIELLNGFCDWKVATDKVCEVVWGKPALQSLNRIVDKFRNSPVMHPHVPDTFKPVVFNCGKRVVFPAPTKRLRAPRRPQDEDSTDAMATASTDSKA